MSFSTACLLVCKHASVFLSLKIPLISMSSFPGPYLPHPKTDEPSLLPHFPMATHPPSPDQQPCRVLWLPSNSDFIGTLLHLGLLALPSWKSVLSSARTLHAIYSPGSFRSTPTLLLRTSSLCPSKTHVEILTSSVMY